MQLPTGGAEEGHIMYLSCPPGSKEAVIARELFGGVRGQLRGVSIGPDVNDSYQARMSTRGSEGRCSPLGEGTTGDWCQGRLPDTNQGGHFLDYAGMRYRQLGRGRCARGVGQQ